MSPKRKNKYKKKTKSFRRTEPKVVVASSSDSIDSSTQVLQMPDFEYWSDYDPNAPLLTMAMMVKNEEEFLEEALNSAKGLVDEMVVVDTGSTDRTVEIAKAHGAKVSHYMWRDDFSDARNETIRRSSGQWVLILDADERLVISKDKIEAFRRALRAFTPEGPYVGVSIDVVNIRLDGSVMNSLPSLRFFPKCQEIRYQNRVHNQLLLAEPDREMLLKMCDFVTINHLGYDPTVYEQRKKSDRSLPLIQKMLEDEPDNMVYKFYEGREFVIKKQPELAVQSLEAAVLGILEGKHGYFAETLKTLLTAYEQVQAKPERIILFTEMGIEKDPTQPDFYLFKGCAERSSGKDIEAVTSLRDALDRWANFKLVEVSQSNPIIAQRVWLAHLTLGETLWDLERYEEAYSAYIETTQCLPNGHPKWKRVINNVIALAIEFNDDNRLKELFEILFSRSNSQLDMFYFKIDQLIAQKHFTEAKELLTWAIKTSSRVKKNVQTHKLKAELGL
jgi:tetratricopeptide (TPR) repeat protein